MFSPSAGMDSADQIKADLRAFLALEGAEVDLGDEIRLPTGWVDQSWREGVIAEVIEHADSKPWAWDALRRL